MGTLYKSVKETNDSESVPYRLKRDQPLLATKSFLSGGDSSFVRNSENNSNSTSTKIYSSIIFDKQSTLISEENYSFLPDINSTNREKSPSMNQFKITEEKSLSSIQNDNEIENDINIITSKIYKFPLPSNKSKVNKSAKKSGSSSKSSDKKEITTATLLPNTTVLFLILRNSPMIIF